MPLFTLIAAMALPPATASADPLHSAPIEIGAAATSEVMVAGLARLPSAVGRSSLDSEVLCLARTIYWEAKSEPHIGKVAVAAVTLNRVNDRRFPATVCGVVTQRSGRSCQFRWACDGRLNVTPSGRLWEQAMAVARDALLVGHQDPTGGALFFHGVRERTDWRGARRLVARIGDHVFYR
jgi:spore germination cell wall hydrolase CwlJ-like protein